MFMHILIRTLKMYIFSKIYILTFMFPNLASSRSLLLVFHLQLSLDPVSVSVFLAIPTHFPYNRVIPFGQVGPAQNIMKITYIISGLALFDGFHYSNKYIIYTFILAQISMRFRAL